MIKVVCIHLGPFLTHRFIHRIFLRFYPYQKLASDGFLYSDQ